MEVVLVHLAYTDIHGCALRHVFIDSRYTDICVYVCVHMDDQMSA